MIPYDIFMMELVWHRDKILQVRGVDPVSDGVYIRVARGLGDISLKRPLKIRCYFLDYEKKQYKEVELSQFTITKVEDEETEKLGALLYLVRTDEECFLCTFQETLKGYLNYIHWKQEHMETEMVDWLVNGDANKPISVGETKAGNLALELLPVEIALSLDCPRMWHSFLNMKFSEFLDYYWKENRLEDSIFVNQRVTHLYIGNQFCPLLFPEEEVLKELMQKAGEHELKPVIVCSTMSESFLERTRERLLLSAYLFRQLEATEPLEIVINDYGIPLLAKEMAEKGEVSKGNFSFTQGVLLHKRTKDPRGIYRKGQEKLWEAQYRTSGDDEEFTTYLMEKFGICRKSFETCGYDFYIPKGEHVLHLPLYQTNTASFCVLHALCRYGDRGHQIEVTDCPQYCERIKLIYEKEVGVLNRWNSLFGCSTVELEDVERLNDMISKGIKRLVVRV